MTDRLSLPTVDVPAASVVETDGLRLRLPALTRRRRVGLATVVVLLAGLGVKASEVDDRLTDDDRRYAALILAEAGVEERPTLGDFASEVAFVRAVQAAVLHVAPVSATETGIPQGQAREPADLYRERRGLCFDRSRVIEKILRVHGLRTRHVSAFHGASGSTSAWVLFDPHTRSHALTEVATSRGWMMADSNSVYVALAQGRALPMDAKAVARGARDPSGPQLDERAPAGTFFATPFLPIRGLYSRHGRFFAPYNAIPDIAWSEMLSFDLRPIPGYPTQSPEPGDPLGRRQRVHRRLLLLGLEVVLHERLEAAPRAARDVAFAVRLAATRGEPLVCAQVEDGHDGSPSRVVTDARFVVEGEGAEQKRSPRRAVPLRSVRSRPRST